MDLPLLDLIVIFIYLVGIIIFGSWFVRYNKTGEDFMIAGSSIPGWAVGLSFFGTYLSSNTFIGVVGRAFGTNWNYFTFSLVIPLAAWIGVKYFIPFYRKSGEISAYHHIEKRFGSWARIYSVSCYLLLQLARIATITYGMALALHGLAGWEMSYIIIISGISITLYTMLGGMKAVIWTDVVQSFVLVSGTIIIIIYIFYEAQISPPELLAVANENSKFSLGSFKLSFSKSTFWVVFLYGLFMNLKAFGFDQNYVQRYHAAKSNKEAKNSLYFGSLLYVPISLLFFFIGSILFSLYQTSPGLEKDLKAKTAMAIVNRETSDLSPEDYLMRVQKKESTLKITDIADHALPHFMSKKLPGGVAGLIIAAIMAAAMSTISTCLNSSATVLYSDIYKKIRGNISEKELMYFLRIATFIWGILGSIAALLMIGSESILAVWWELSSIVAGAMLGLFLLGFVSKKVDGQGAAISVFFGIIVIAWIGFSSKVSFLPDFLKSPFHTYMSVVIATISMFTVGILISHVKTRRKMY
ncbi:sodium:solute symporter [Maribellus maritimus]|uniref:sodium:solute symporter n=1 Tax=Maribellus maritimus TaxID=2870838 RepID=UPI001EEC7191|nr:sodium:solute symporter [Maribellus maritimus]MCG6189536.1 sodium:solute symporter [Maribellus maritimus]